MQRPMGIGDRQPVVTTDNGGNNQAVTTTTTTTTTQSNPTPAAAKPTDVNIADPRLLINGTCIYERRLPGHAYITAHVQRLQHGYYSCPALSNAEFEHVDFLAVNFVFHAPHTSSHRFKAARIRASISNKDICPQHPFSNAPIENPRFLMYAPHLIYGAVSPESLGVGLGMRGSVGVSQFPVNASVIPSGVMNESYKRFEMMRIQGSVRTLVSPWGDRFDVDAGEISWSMEENSLQRSGLPREFTFVMLVQKPRADSDISFNLRIKPRIQTRIGRVWKLRLALPKYRTWRRKPVDFNKEIGQRFQPVSSDKGYNFADIQSCLDDYVNMPGSTYTPKMSPDGVVPVEIASGNIGGSANANPGGNPSSGQGGSQNASGNPGGNPGENPGRNQSGYANGGLGVGVGGFAGFPITDGSDDVFTHFNRLQRPATGAVSASTDNRVPDFPVPVPASDFSDLTATEKEGCNVVCLDRSISSESQAFGTRETLSLPARMTATSDTERRGIRRTKSMGTLAANGQREEEMTQPEE